jgi:anti-sigma regulatory factor (Ser/Thr protein kinase)
MMERRITISAEMEEIPRALEIFEEVMAASGFCRQEMLRLQLAVEEACANIVLHGYGEEEGKICLKALVDGDRLFVTVEDEGEPFDPTACSPPRLEEDLEGRGIGGLGIHLMRSLVDGISYEFMDGKNVLTLMMKRDRSSDAIPGGER